MKQWIPSILSLLAICAFPSSSSSTKLTRICKTKKFWLKESVIRARCCVLRYPFLVVDPSRVSCRRHLSVSDWNITEWSLLGSFAFSQHKFHRKASFFSVRPSSFVMLCTSPHIRQLVLTCAFGHALIGDPKNNYCDTKSLSLWNETRLSTQSWSWNWNLLFPKFLFSFVID